MEENNYNLGTRPDPTETYASGIAHVVLPKDVDRAKYIAECYRTSTVSIYSEHNGFYNRVPVDIFSLNFIEFPLTPDEFGSKVSYKVDPVHKRPIVDAIYRDPELSDLVENQFKFKRHFNGNIVEIVGSPDGKYIGLNVVSVEKGGEVSINVSSKDESGKITINVDGECSINALTDTTIKQHGKLQLITVNRGDEDEYTIEEHTSTGRTITSKNEDLITESFVINDGKENFILGKLFKKYMQELVNELASATVTTSFGAMPLLNKAAIKEFATDEKIDKFLSTVAFIDK